MASDGSDTSGAVYASLGPVIGIILLAALFAAALAIAMGWLHQLANPSARSERDVIPLKHLKMLAAWPIEYILIAWVEMTAHRLAIKRYKPRHAAH